MLVEINPQEKIISIQDMYAQNASIQSLRDWCDARISENINYFTVDIEWGYYNDISKIDITPIEQNR